MALRVPPLCNKCQSKRVARSKPRVDFCYDCLPGGPFTPPPCSRCATTTDYFSQGLCQRCHPRSPERVGPQGLPGVGRVPAAQLQRWTCRWWRQHYTRGAWVTTAVETPRSGTSACLPRTSADAPRTRPRPRSGRGEQARAAALLRQHDLPAPQDLGGCRRTDGRRPAEGRPGPPPKKR